MHFQVQTSFVAGVTVTKWCMPESSGVQSESSFSRIRVDRIDTKRLLKGLTIHEIIDRVDAIEDLDSGEFVNPNMAVVASYVDDMYEKHESLTSIGFVS